mmetsp:Transcript_27676/g.50265  ORF Transcript_27676/g.50265 Transcript_27676/m.50265 type:complete len:211 (+) Transcript_27676:233-865(+)
MMNGYSHNADHPHYSFPKVGIRRKQSRSLPFPPLGYYFLAALAASKREVVYSEESSWKGVILKDHLFFYWSLPDHFHTWEEHSFERCAKRSAQSAVEIGLMSSVEYGGALRVVPNPFEWVRMLFLVDLPPLVVHVHIVGALLQSPEIRQYLECSYRTDLHYCFHLPVEQTTTTTTTRLVSIAFSILLSMIDVAMTPFGRDYMGQRVKMMM